MVGNDNLLQRIHPQIDSGIVHIHHVLPFAAIGFCHRFLKVRRGGFGINNVGQFKKGRLHQHIKTPAEAEFTCNIDRVQGVKPHPLAGNNALHFIGQMALHLFAKPGAVEQENPARIDAIKKIIFIDIRLL